MSEKGGLKEEVREGDDEEVAGQIEETGVGRGRRPEEGVREVRGGRSESGESEGGG